MAVPGTATLTDELVRQAAEGAPEELGRLIEAIQPQVRLMVLARLCPLAAQMHDVEEIVQEALMGLVRGLGRLRCPSVQGLRVFLSGLVSRRVAAFFRRRRRHLPSAGQMCSLDTTVAGESCCAALWQLLSCSGTSPLSAADRAERVARVLGAFATLTAEQREAITLAFFDQLTPDQIGLRMGLSRGAAAMLVVRALRALRASVTPMGEGAAGGQVRADAEQIGRPG
jgi:RNA polymerase sigma factor (sigma-70 family)